MNTAQNMSYIPLALNIDIKLLLKILISIIKFYSQHKESYTTKVSFRESDLDSNIPLFPPFMPCIEYSGEESLN